MRLDNHLSANVAYSTKYNSDVSLSRYAVIGESALVDFAVGAGKHDKTFDVSLVVKNLSDQPKVVRIQKQEAGVVRGVDVQHDETV